MDDNSSASTMFNMSSVATPLSITISYQGASIVIYPENTPFVIGRDQANCDLFVDTEYASRTHCKITFTKKSFFLEDCSTNGTHIRVGAAPPLKLQGNSMHLVGNGGIKLGQGISVGDPDLILFKLAY